MTFTYLISEEDRLILERMEGVINRSFLIQSFHEVWNNIRFNKNYNILLDLRAAQVKITAAELNQLIGTIVKQRANTTARIALIVTRPFETALAMLFESKISKQNNTGIFSEPANAARFVNVDEERIHSLFEEKSVQLELDNSE